MFQHFKFVHPFFAMVCADQDGKQGVRSPSANHKNIGFSSNTGPDPLKITKLPSQHSMLGNHRHDSVCWWTDDGPLMVAFGSHTKNVVIVGPPLA